MPHGRGCAKHISIRIPPDLLAEVEAAVGRANYYATTKGPSEPVTLRSWVKKAMEDRLAHLERRRRQTARKTAARRQRKADTNKVCGTADACQKVVASTDDTRHEIAA